MKTKLNRLNWIIAGAFLLTAGCKKKERLTSSTYTFSVTPPAVTVVKNQQQTFTARGESEKGSIDMGASTWAISPDASADLSGTAGASIAFTPSALGDYTITVTNDGRTATSHVAVVTYQPNSNTYDVYIDAGLPPASTGVDSDIFTSGSFLSELSTGYTPEGVKYEHADSVPVNGFWGVTLDKNNSGKKQNLSAFISGRLRFAIRLGQVLGATDKLRIDLTDAASAIDRVTSDNWTGFSNGSTDWQEVSIPLIIFSTVDKSQIKVPFSIVVNAPLSTASVSFDIDAVRWEK